MKVAKLANWKTWVAMAAGMAIAGGVAVAQDMSEDSIAERIKPAGQVRMAGESSAAQSAGSSEPRSGEEVYNQACSACHAGGVLGAPKKGNAGDWEERIAKGMDVLLDHSINGFNAMPPRGGCGACSDEEIEAAVEHMIAGL
ncbi:c-type cytochrome [Aliidiomarina sedimenti]